MRITKAGRKRKPRETTLQRTTITFVTTPGMRDRFCAECVPLDSSMARELRRLMQNEIQRVRANKKRNDE